MHTLAHRGYLAGPAPARENQRAALAECLELGFGIETDIRRTPDGQFYISHDACEPAPEQLADRYVDAFRSARAPIALNLKELGYEAQLVEFLERRGLLERVFVFDMELIEPVRGQTARMLRALQPRLRLAARVSDRGESVEAALAIHAADVIWLDEFERLWASAADIRLLKAAGKTVYAVSPELHGFELWVARRRWQEFHSWGVDGLCTDWPQAATQRAA